MDLILNAQAVQGQITDNFEEITEQLATAMEPYMATEVSPAIRKETKAQLVYLRKAEKAFEEKRRAIKAEYLEPYTTWEARYKLMLDPLRSAITHLDDQVKAIENEELQEKLKEVEELIDERLAKEEPGFEAYMRTMNDLRSPRWVNKTVSLKQIATEIDVSIQTVHKALAVLDDGSKYAPQVLAYYADHGNLADAIQYRKKLEVDDTKYAAMQKEKELIQANVPAFEPGMPTTEPAPAPVPTPAPDPSPTANEDGYEISIPYAVAKVGKDNPRVKLVFEIDAPIQYIKFLKDTSEALEIGTMTRIKRTPQKENI
jgi:hypothetical protein